jgi:hypothetical protein
MTREDRPPAVLGYGSIERSTACAALSPLTSAPSTVPLWGAGTVASPAKKRVSAVGCLNRPTLDRARPAMPRSRTTRLDRFAPPVSFVHLEERQARLRGEAARRRRLGVDELGPELD